MKQFFALIKDHSQGPRVALFFVLTNAVYLLMLLVTIPLVMDYSGGLNLPDMMPTGFGTDYLNALFYQLDVEGRETYLYRQLPIDLIYPLLFGVTYSLLFAFVLEKLNAWDSIFRSICLFPVLAGLFDYLENLGLIYLLKSYPAMPNGIIQASNIMTIGKSLFTTLYFLALIFALAFLAIASFRKKA